MKFYNMYSSLGKKDENILFNVIPLLSQEQHIESFEDNLYNSICDLRVIPITVERVLNLEFKIR